MSNTIAVFKRELIGYFATPVAYVVLAVFIGLTGLFAWEVGGLYDTDNASLQPFFIYHPILYPILISALTMRLWSEERRGGTIEMLLTLPISVSQAVIGKFAAAWAFTAIALLLTTTEWFTIAYLGDPDHGVIFAAYLGSLLMAGGFIAIGSCLSAVTKNQVIAFVLSFLVCFIFVMAGYPLVLDMLPDATPEVLVEMIRSFSFWTHFSAISRGVIDLRDLVYFGTVIAVFLFATVALVDLKKAD